MKAGAVDFLTKPVKSRQLLAAIALAAEKEAQALELRSELASINDRISRLTPREREVLTHVIAGRLNKQIAGGSRHRRKDDQAAPRSDDAQDGRAIGRGPCPHCRAGRHSAVAPARLRRRVGPRSISTIVEHSQKTSSISRRMTRPSNHLSGRNSFFDALRPDGSVCLRGRWRLCRWRNAKKRQFRLRSAM